MIKIILIFFILLGTVTSFKISFAGNFFSNSFCGLGGSKFSIELEFNERDLCMKEEPRGFEGEIPKVPLLEKFTNEELLNFLKNSPNMYARYMSGRKYGCNVIGEMIEELRRRGILVAFKTREKGG